MKDMKKFAILFLIMVSGACVAQIVMSPGAMSTPTTSPGPGTYSVTQSVTINALSGSYVCYTTDGSTPAGGATGCTTGTHYTGAISVPATTTIKAKAFKAYYVPSAVLADTYTISGGGGHPAVFTGVTHYWHMSEAANSTRSDSVGTSHLTDANSNTGVATGLLHANAVSYTGAANQNLTISSPITLSAASNWTLGQWIYLNTGVTHFRMFDGTNSNAYFNSSTFFVTDDAGNPGNGSLTAPSTGGWHLITIVGTPCTTYTCINVYVDNGSANAIGYSNSFPGSFTIQTVGDKDAYYSESWRLGDAFLFVGTALSSSDIATIWNGGAGLDY